MKENFQNSFDNELCESTSKKAQVFFEVLAEEIIKKMQPNLILNSIIRYETSVKKCRVH